VIILVEHGRVNWVDFYMARFDELSMRRFRQDMGILVKSIFISSIGVQLQVPSQVDVALQAYEHSSDTSVFALIDAIRNELERVPSVSSPLFTSCFLYPML